MNSMRLLVAACVALAPVPARGVIISHYRGLDHLIDNADAVVVVRIEKNVDAGGVSVDLCSTHECYVYATLKGDVKPGDRVRMRLMDTSEGGVSPYGLSTTHLLFLKRDDGVRWSYRSVAIRGSNLPTSPAFRDATVKGLAVKDAVKALVREFAEYQQARLKREKALFDKILGEK